MGISTDFVVAEPGSGRKIGESINPAEAGPTFQAKGIDTVKLARLYCVIAGKQYSSDIRRSFGLVGGNEERGPWVFEFPSEILRTFAGVAPDQVQGVAKAWSSTDELKMDRWSVEDASWVVENLTAHARKAVESGKAMFLRLSL